MDQIEANSYILSIHMNIYLLDPHNNSISQVFQNSFCVPFFLNSIFEELPKIVPISIGNEFFEHTTYHWDYYFLLIHLIEKRCDGCLVCKLSLVNSSISITIINEFHQKNVVVLGLRLEFGYDKVLTNHTNVLLVKWEKGQQIQPPSFLLECEDIKAQIIGAHLNELIFDLFVFIDRAN